MDSKTDEQIAKENRLRTFRQEGARVTEDAVTEAIAVRENMERLRGLRLTKEAQAASAAKPVTKIKPIKPSK